jgi:outer membrane protein
MKTLRRILFITGSLAASAIVLCAATPSAPVNEAVASEQSSHTKIATVNFKYVVENSKVGKQEQANFEGMKKKMESSLEEREKVITEMSKQLNDADFLDTLSPEAETDLKRKFRSLSQEMSQLQNQYYQTLSQANFKVVQMISEVIGKASGEVAKGKNIDLILNDEGSFYHSPSLDVSKDVVVKMDEIFEKEGANTNTTPAAQLSNLNSK